MRWDLNCYRGLCTLGQLGRWLPSIAGNHHFKQVCNAYGAELVQRQQQFGFRIDPHFSVNVLWLRAACGSSFSRSMQLGTADVASQFAGAKDQALRVLSKHIMQLYLRFISLKGY